MAWCSKFQKVTLRMYRLAQLAACPHQQIFSKFYPQSVRLRTLCFLQHLWWKCRKSSFFGAKHLFLNFLEPRSINCWFLASTIVLTAWQQKATHLCIYTWTSLFSHQHSWLCYSPLETFSLFLSHLVDRRGLYHNGTHAIFHLYLGSRTEKWF